MKKPEPWPVTAPRPPRGPPRIPGGRPSGPPKRRKKRSIGEPGWNGESSLLELSSLATFSLILTFTEITDGLTRSTMSAKPIGWATLRTSLLTCAWALVVKISMGRSVIKASPEPELEMVRGACTGRPRTWGFQPYNALAKELNFGNEPAME